MFLIIMILFIPIKSFRGYVRQYCNVPNRAFMYDFMHDFDHFCAQFLSVNQIESNAWMRKSRISCENNARFLHLMCKIAHHTALTLSLELTLSISLHTIPKPTVMGESCTAGAGHIFGLKIVQSFYEYGLKLDQRYRVNSNTMFHVDVA